MTYHSTFYDGLVSASTEQLLGCFCGYSVPDFLTLSSHHFLQIQKLRISRNIGKHAFEHLTFYLAGTDDSKTTTVYH